MNRKLVLVGSGPHHLTLAAFLLARNPGWRDGLQVVDPAGRWLAQWDKQMSDQEIRHLRSSSVHHPDPDPTALRRFARGRWDEFYPPYYLPGTGLFRDFCAHVIDKYGLEDLVVRDRLVGLRWIQESRSWDLGLESGGSWKGDYVSFALGGGSPILPAWLSADSGIPADRLSHSDQVSLPGYAGTGETVAVIGGGLTASHLALGALKRGNQVHWFSRRPLETKLFDAAPSWIGPRDMTKFFAERDWKRRRAMIREARGGGAVTPELMGLLEPYRRQSDLHWQEDFPITGARWDGRAVFLRNSSQELEFDRVWVCTGQRYDFHQIPEFGALEARFPLEWVDDLPVLTDELRWPGLHLFFMGIPAGLRIGPTARNLPGARKAAALITDYLETLDEVSRGA